ncbi:hypothetical protein Franean1_5453 [Parafrankia sp. EAN1pec]|uniref:hypothetical protein n=1 Tax=Parafrankia sp. (strain EAN1pec) TaxID=298653 RepID=UPI0000542C5E|nr:hypothetical protein Franean1_5453 [Frankia sp. EAN1pec]
MFASGRIPLDRTRTSIGPISVEIVEPLRVNRILVDAAEHGLVADLTATARTPAHEEPRATQYDGTELRTDSTRATQMVTWTALPQVFFLRAPLNFADECLHYVVMENEAGQPWLERTAVLPVLGEESPVFGMGTRPMARRTCRGWRDLQGGGTGHHCSRLCARSAGRTRGLG